MGILCPACGQMSQGTDFCDHCHEDLTRVHAALLPPPHCPVSAAGVELTAEQQSLLIRPGGSLLIRVQGNWQRVHWISRESWPLWSARVRERLGKNTLSCLPAVHVVEEGSGIWVLAEATNEVFQPWHICLANPHDEVERFLHYFTMVAACATQLNDHGLVWLTFDPRHLEPDDRNGLRINNLDLGVHPAGTCPDSLPVKIAFAAPEIIRYHPANISPRTDVFHLALFGYYWLAGLLPHGFPGLGLSSFDFRIPKLRIYAPHLPLGFAGVLAKGLAEDPAERQDSAKVLVAELQDVVEHNRRRRAFAGQLQFEVGAESRTGRTKTALGRDNEDSILKLAGNDPERVLAAVADGITTCDVGSGALASLITAIVLENNFGPTCTQQNFEDEIANTCRHCAQTLLDWALEKGYRGQLEAGADLMGTTLTAVCVEGTQLSVANLGDSRAYLVSASAMEQLTVDGDLASGMLAEGTPPEQVFQVGPVAKALRECIGGCIYDGARLTILDEGCIPTLTRWPLLPGDVIVLCSDGLIEEDIFLEPGTVADVIRRHGAWTAQQLAMHLVDEADKSHRLPSLLEPDGFGDNISCIVIKVAQAVTKQPFP